MSEESRDEQDPTGSVEPEELTGTEIAVVGMACRFPGAESVDAFWRNLRDGVDSYRELTPEELDEAGVDPEAVRSGSWVPLARAIADYDRFDPDFFGMASWEAEVMEPQYRIFLECAWEAFEDAGYDPSKIPGPVGVFAGSRASHYLLHLATRPDVVRQVGEMAVSLANEKDYLATRVSYLFGLMGPSVSVQTACSTSLSAVHMGCQALIAGEADSVLAGGVALRYPNHGYPHQPGGVQSSDGRVRAFDARADGTMFGSGMGAVVLKRLEDALEDGDTVRAVIRGSGVSNDGSQKVGFAAPSMEGQSLAIRSALLVADVDPETLDYVEAHGTGTPMGDPIEVQALTRVFRESTRKTGYCALGSVKSNIGHASSASGIAGLIKTVLALENEAIPPSLGYERPNPQIDFESSPFFVNDALRPWPRGERPRRAGVSSFGMGGTNVHVILEEAPPRPAAADARRPHHLLPLSGRTAEALERQGESLARHLEEHAELDPADVAYTLQVGRRAHGHRRAVVCGDREEAIRTLRDGAAGRSVSGACGERSPAVAFMFSGQGAQYPGMARGLYQGEPAFAEAFDRCAEILDPHLREAGADVGLRELVMPDGGDAEAAAGRLERTAFAQPALVAVEYSLARLWSSWGLEPRAQIGHSIGEYTAACLAGVFSLEDALAVVAARGRLMQELPEGSMMAVPLSEDDLRERLDAQLSVAAVNAEGRCVVSGPSEAVDGLRKRLEEEGLACRPLHTSHAFHSAMMEPMLAPFAQCFEGVTLHPPRIPFPSNVTGTWITDEEATDPAYWVRHVRSPVRFAAGVEELLADEGTALLEVGPGNTLVTLARRYPARRPEQAVVASVRHPKESVADQAFLLEALGRLWTAGVEVDWNRLHDGERRSRVPLPTYPFERSRYWVDPGDAATLRAGGRRPKSDVADWFYLPSWRPSLPPAPAADLEESPRTWWVFDGGEPLAARTIETLRARGQRVITVTPGEGFEEAGTDAERAFRVEPGRRPDYDALVEALLEDAPPDVVLHLWTVTGEVDGAAGPEALPEAEARAFWSQLFLAQALGKHSLERPVRWLTVSDGVHRLGGERALQPEKATLLGPVKVIPVEYPGVTATAVDVIAPEAEADLDELVDGLLAEATGAAEDSVVAVRHGERWVQDWTDARLDAGSDDDLPLRRQGVYLVTGGLGGIGLTLAEHLAREHDARLVLLGRTAIPERAQWDAWLEEHDPEDRTSRKLRRIRALEELGAEVVTPSVDVTDPEQVGGAIRDAVERFGTIHGVVHAAGLPGGGMIQLKSEEAAAAVLAPKVRGTVVLEAALAEAGVRPDFFVVCSSTISCIGGFGQVDYCAANSFLDAWAHAQRVRRERGEEVPLARSVSWGAWEEVGMAVDTGLVGRESEGGAAPGGSGADGIHPAEGVEAFRRLLSRRVRTPHVVASARDLHALLETARAVDRRRLMDGAEAGRSTGRTHARPDLGTPYVAPRDGVEEDLAEIWAASLGLEEVGVQDNFFDLGGDSVMAIQLIARAHERGYELEPDHLFQHQTIAELARVLGDEPAGADDRPAAERWEEWLRERAAGPWADAAEHWLEAADLEAVELAPEGAEGARESLELTLGAEARRALTEDALDELRASPEEVVLAALAAAVRGRWDGPRLWVRLVGDGRDVASAASVLRGAAEPLPYSFPLLVDLRGLEAERPVELVRRIKEQRRSVPGEGAAYPALLLAGEPDARGRLERLPTPQLALSAGPGEPDAGGVDTPAAPLAVHVRKGHEALVLAWTGGADALDRSTVEALGVETVELLERIARSSGEAADEALSPTDFPDAELDRDDLDKVLSKLGD